MEPLYVYKQIGKSCTNHLSYLVQRNKLVEVVNFFINQLGWTELTNKLVSGDWGMAVSIESGIKGDVPIQLIQHNDTDGENVFPGTHIGISVKDAKVAATVVKEWAEAKGYKCITEPANKSERDWFVCIPELMTFKLEFVTTPW